MPDVENGAWVRKMRVFILTPDRAYSDDIEDSLDVFYHIIGCNVIDIVTRRVAGVPFSIICDDEGMLKENYVTALTSSGDIMLVGNLIFCHVGKDGELKGLSDSEIDLLESMIRVGSLDGQKWNVIVGMEV